jgi:hypothetical protein
LYVTFVSFQENKKGDRTIAFRFYGDPDGIRTVYFPKMIRETFILSKLLALYGDKGRSIPSQWGAVAKRCQTRRLRQVAREYGVSHEAVRRIVRKLNGGEVKFGLCAYLNNTANINIPFLSIVKGKSLRQFFSFGTLY